MKDYKMQVTKETSAQVQMACFSQGIYWSSGVSDVQLTNSPYLYVEDKEDKEMFGPPSGEIVIMYGHNEAGFDNSPNIEISAEDFIELLKGDDNVR